MLGLAPSTGGASCLVWRMIHPYQNNVGLGWDGCWNQHINFYMAFLSIPCQISMKVHARGGRRSIGSERQTDRQRQTDKQCMRSGCQHNNFNMAFLHPISD